MSAASLPAGIDLPIRAESARFAAAAIGALTTVGCLFPIPSLTYVAAGG
jgi:hypothetical protein